MSTFTIVGGVSSQNSGLSAVFQSKPAISYTINYSLKSIIGSTYIISIKDEYNVKLTSDLSLSGNSLSTGSITVVGNGNKVFASVLFTSSIANQVININTFTITRTDTGVVIVPDNRVIGLVELLPGVSENSNLVVGLPQVLNQSIADPSSGIIASAHAVINSDKSLTYPAPYNKQNGNLYVQNDANIGGECNCQDLVIHAKGSIIPQTEDLFVRGNVYTQPGSVQKSALGFDGGSYYTNLPLGTKEYKTQVFDEAGPITRQLIPKSKRPLQDPSQNIILCICDGMGRNQEWNGRLLGDFIEKYGNFMSSDLSDNRVDYMSDTVNGGSLSGTNITNINNFQLSWGKNSTFEMEYDPIASEYFVNSQKNYAGVTYDRNEIIKPGFTNDDSGYLVPDSAATATAFATGRLPQNEIINTLAADDFTSNQKPSIYPPYGQMSKVRTSFKTIFEDAKLAGKATCIMSTSNIFHATPASFVSKSSHRDNYIDLIRTCFGPNGSNPNLIIGPTPSSGNDVNGSAYNDASGYATYAFPEVDSTWTNTKIDASGRLCVSAVTYAKRYGYTVITDPSSCLNYNTPITNTSKVWLAHQTGACQCFIGSGNAIASTGIIKVNSKYLRPNGVVSSTGVITSGTLSNNSTLTQTEALNKGVQLLKNASNGFIMMYEDSEPDWAGHVGSAVFSAIETLEGSKAMRDAVYHSDVSSNTTIIVTPDHECGGWSWVDASGNVDGTDERLDANPEQFLATATNYLTDRRVHLYSNFIATDLSFNVTTSLSQGSHSIQNPYFGVPSTLYNDISGVSTLTSSCIVLPNSVLNGSADDTTEMAAYKTWASSNVTSAIPPRTLVKVTDSSNNIYYCRTDISGSNIVLVRAKVNFGNSAATFTVPLGQSNITNTTNKAALDASANLPFTLNGTIKLSFRLPLSQLGTYASSQSISESTIATLMTSYLKRQYDANQLYAVNIVGKYDESDLIRDFLMYSTIMNANTCLSASNNASSRLLTYAPIHTKDLPVYSQYLNPNTSTMTPAVYHLQSQVFNMGLTNDWLSHMMLGFTQYYSHSSSICQIWAKSTPCYDNTYTNLGIKTAWAGVGTKPSDFLSGKSLSGMGINKLLTGTI